MGRNGQRIERNEGKRGETKEDHLLKEIEQKGRQIKKGKIKMRRGEMKWQGEKLFDVELKNRDEVLTNQFFEAFQR